MISGTLNRLEREVAPGYECIKIDRIESELPIDEKRGASGGTVYFPAGANEIAGAVYVEISTAVSGTGTVRIGREGDATLVRSAGSNFLVLTGAQNDGPIGQVLSEGLAIRGLFQPAA